MDKILYVSDLDGTLLNSSQALSEQSLKLLNTWIKKGIHFSIATARTPATVTEILQELTISIPVVLMNGSVLYDLKNQHYIKVEYIAEEVVKLIMQNLGSLCYEGFIYTIVEDKLLVYYENLINDYQKIFFDERQDKPQKTFVKKHLEDYSKVVYFTFMDTYEKIEVIYKKIEQLPGLALSMYRDIYNEGAYFLEVYSDRATKANAVISLKEQYDYDKIISFGDNLNDLTMFKISDECYAVYNAHPTVKESATGVILHHDDDAVAKFIDEHQTLAKRRERITEC